MQSPRFILGIVVGVEFGCGSHASTLNAYKKATESLSRKLAVSGMAFQAQCNPNSFDLEFRLEPLILAAWRFRRNAILTPSILNSGWTQISHQHIISDLKFSFDSFVHLETMCHVEFSEHQKEYPTIPPELIVLPSNGTIVDLRTKATKTFHKVYAMLNKFEARELPDYGSLEDSISIKFLAGQSGAVRIKGMCPSEHALRHF
ncbi:hypothetical protein SADUNF_Sadunf13G0069500 [Salix dunnii]|uniref:PHD finger protein MALE STERILITY 1-like ubiquitin-like domain-containing protein n=1 Tax=Salix dunnii TaxID=1413687 RepID=A0A835JKU6_9ROSI|nr:hypothetical protein SADUNF_Sadunf13G0069500 [Salix dunnii]